jgi:hypothetical protein
MGPLLRGDGPVIGRDGGLSQPPSSVPPALARSVFASFLVDDCYRATAPEAVARPERPLWMEMYIRTYPPKAPKETFAISVVGAALRASDCQIISNFGGVTASHEAALARSIRSCRRQTTGRQVDQQSVGADILGLPQITSSPSILGHA